MANAIMEVLCKFGLAEKTLALTTDNASSMIAAGQKLKETLNNYGLVHQQYAVHILNLAVQYGLQLVSPIIKNV